MPVPSRALCCLLCAALFATAPVARTRLPQLGDGSEITLGDERRLGERIVRELYRDPAHLEDAVLQEYVQGIWQPLVAAARIHGQMTEELEQRFAWEILLVRERSVNAFALPGGYLGVHLGLIGVVGTRDELASVLAHELSHVTQRHIARMFAHQGRQTPLMLGAMILGALAAASRPDAGAAMMVGGQALAARNQLGFSRDMEREADRMGYQLMEPAGFAPQGFVGMFAKLEQASRLNDNGSWPYLRSHPLTSERMADMQLRLPPSAGAALGASAGTSPAVEDLEHRMMVARARVLARPGVDVLRQWAARPQMDDFPAQNTAQQAEQGYAAVLSAMQLRDWTAARRMLAALQTLSAQDAAARRQAHLLAAELELAAGQPEAAWQALEKLGPHAVAAPAASASLSLADIRAAPPRPATRRPELLLRAETLLHSRARTDPDREKMAGLLQAWLGRQPQDAAAWQLLSGLWHAAGRELHALRATAEARMAHHDYPAARDRLLAAQALARKRTAPDAADRIEAAIIDTRLRAVQERLRAQEE